MKTLFISNNSNIWVDSEENECNTLPTEREAIQRIYLAQEPMHVIYQAGEYKREVDVKKDDLIITFYTDDFENRMIVVKNKDWVNNIKKYNKREQERKEKWAAENTQCCDCCECKSC